MTAVTVTEVNTPFSPSISSCATGVVNATSWVPPMLSRSPV